MRLLYINPNSTETMTDQVVAVARAAVPEATVSGWTNHAGPPAIQGPEDGAAAVAGLMSMLPAAAAAGADVIIIACFDDTGLDDLRAAAHCPVIGIGQAAYVTAALARGGFAVVTTLQVSVPVLEANITRYGLSSACTAVLASGLPVLTVEQGGEAVLARLSDSIADAVAGGAKAVALGCAGMAHLRADLMARTAVPLVDGVAASAHLARALVQSLR